MLTWLSFKGFCCICWEDSCNSFFIFNSWNRWSFISHWWRLKKILQKNTIITIAKINTSGVDSPFAAIIALVYQPDIKFKRIPIPMSNPIGNPRNICLKKLLSFSLFFSQYIRNFSSCSVNIPAKLTSKKLKLHINKSLNTYIIIMYKLSDSLSLAKT